MRRSTDRFKEHWAPLAKAEIRAMRAFDRPSIQRAVAELAHQASVENTNRKPLREGLEGLPDVTWQVRVNRWRVLYWVDGKTVYVLRVILKDGTTAESL
jgi:hypothetical protein